MQTMLRIARILVATTAIFMATGPQAADITGAGSTFAYPIFAKWADAYKKSSGVGDELPVDRLGRRHRPDQGQDRRFRRVGHAAHASPTSTRPD